MKNNIIVSGVPRAGKSTVSHLLASKYGYQHVSMDFNHRRFREMLS